MKPSQLKLGASYSVRAAAPRLTIATTPFLYTGLSSKFLAPLRSKGLMPSLIDHLNVVMHEDKKAAVKDAQQIAKKEGGSPLLVAVEYSDSNVQKYGMTTDSPEGAQDTEILPSKLIPWRYIHIIDVVNDTSLAAGVQTIATENVEIDLQDAQGKSVVKKKFFEAKEALGWLLREIKNIVVVEDKLTAKYNGVTVTVSVSEKGKLAPAALLKKALTNFSKIQKNEQNDPFAWEAFNPSTKKTKGVYTAKDGSKFDVEISGGISYNCPFLKIFGERDELRLARAIEKKNK